MLRSSWFTLVLGMIVGLVVGYGLAERQPVPLARALAGARPAVGSSPGSGMPEGHPPIPSGGDSAAARAELDAQSRRLLDLQAQKPDDPALMVALGNLYFDAAERFDPSRWPDARDWYERALERKPDEPEVLVDLAVTYRNLRQYDRSLLLLDKAVALAPDLWQAWYNRALVLSSDLNRNADAVAALEQLRRIRAANPAVPDLSGLEKSILGAGKG